MCLRPSVLCLVLTACTSPHGWSQGESPSVVLKAARPVGATVNVRLQAADPGTLARTLGETLGGVVRIESQTATPVTLDLQGAPAASALDAVATALHGSWRPVYTLTPGGAPGARRPVALGRTVTASLEG